VEQNNIQNCPLCGHHEFDHFMSLKDNMITKEDFNVVSCKSCGFHFTSPIPSIDDIGRYYKSEDYISHSSSKKGFINSIYNRVRNYTLKQKVKLVSDFSTGKNLLDVGSGTGHFLNQAKLDGFSVQGLEPDSDAVDFAKQNFNIDLEPLSTLYHIEANSKDVITMWHVLEHVYDLQKDFTQLVNVLKPNACLVIAVPNMESYDANYYKEMWAAYDVPRHLYHFRKNDINFLAEKHNCKLIAVKPMKFDSFYVSMLSEKYKGGNIVKAFFVGLKSNMRASKNGGYSSQIYILRKN
jgi:2-polyprenyl-3-methyl-5-hydroxy-6-metoxy-1,4-benzoquinol methylase